MLVLVTLLIGLPAEGALRDRPDWLTVDEKAWLDRHPVIRVGPAPAFPPIEFFNERGEYSGIAADYLREISTLLDVQFDVRRFRDWQAVLDATRHGEVDMWAEAANTAPRRTYMRFTRPYIRMPSLIITRKNLPSLTPEAMSGMTVVAVAGYASTEAFQRRYPEIRVRTVPTVADALNQVSWGQADAAIAASGPAVYFMERLGITNLHVAGQSGYEWALSMAVRKDWPELASILEKALDHIPETTQSQIMQRWIRLDTSHARTERWIWMTLIATICTLVVAGILAWNRSLRNLVARHAAVLAEQRHARQKHLSQVNQLQSQLEAVFDISPQPLMVLAPDGSILRINEAGLRLFELTPADLQDFRKAAMLSSPKEDRQHLDQRWRETIAAGDGRFRWIIRAQLSMKDRKVEVHARPLPHHSPPAVLVALTDLTGQDERLNERAEEFRHLYAEASQAVNRLQEAVDSLRNALTQPDSWQDSTTLLAAQQSALQTLQRLVEDACTAGLFSCFPPDPARTMLNIRGLLEEELPELEHAAQRYGVQVSLLPVDPGLHVFTDPRHLYQAVRYLFRVAGQLANPDSTISLSVQNLTDHVTLAITYHGRPVPSAQSARALNPQLATLPGLSGYELYLARHYIQAQGGRLIIDSAGELSTVMYLRLPRCEDSETDEGGQA